jgi:branched-chain amino acid transport system permease protein
VFVVVVFGGLGSLTGCFIASLLMRADPDLCRGARYSVADLLKWFGLTVTSATPFREVDGAAAAPRRCPMLLVLILA